MDADQAIDYLLQHVAGVLAKQTDQVLQEQLGIGVAQYKILKTLQATPELGQRAIAHHLGQTEAGISRQIKILIAKGLLQSTINPRSKREHLAILTPKGNKLTDASHQVVLHYLQPMLATIPGKQQKQLVETLVALHAWTCRPGKQTACDHPHAV